MVSEAQACSRIDDSFGPYAGECRGGFDFTLLFEETILSILPLILLLILVPFRVAYLLKRERKVNSNLLLPTKLLLYAIFGVSHVALLVLWAREATYKTRISVANSVITLLEALVLPILSLLEHQRTIHPSLILNVFLFFTTLFGAVRLRTLWLQQYNTAMAAATTAVWIIKVLLAVVESLSKRSILRVKWKGSSPESTSSPYEKVFFWWLNPLFFIGYRRSFTADDLYPLDKHLTSTYLYEVLQTPWSRMTQRAPRSLFLLTFKQLRWDLLYAVPPRLAQTAFTFCQPFLIQRTVNLANEPITASTTHAGIGLIGAYLLVYVGIAITTAQYQHMTYRAVTMMRGGLVSMLFAKTSSLKSNAVDPASSLTLMSADIERIWNGWQLMHEIWACIIEIAIAIYLLDLQLGAACAIPIAVAIVSLVGSLLVMSTVVKKQSRWLEAIERRISATASMLGSMKRIKMCGLTDTLLQNLHGLRIEELRISKGFRRLLIGNMFFAFTTPVIAPVLTFMAFSLLALRNGSQPLDATKVFTSLSLFALLTEPLTSMIMALMAFAGSLGCFARIQAFLEQPDHVDNRLKGDDDCWEISESSQSESLATSSVTSKEKDIRTAVIEKAFMSQTAPKGEALTVDDASFGWDTEKDPLLTIRQLQIPNAKLTVLIGPVGCGKTTLLKALLGEVPTLSGSVKVYADDFSYCDQSPFHMNGTVRDSITAFAEYDERWYNSVVGACALDEDFKQMPSGDQTRIGSKGIALSGGQSQRVALARAAYARRDICLLDDVLSGLDMDTENQVFHNLLGTDGLLRRQNTTVIMASSSSRRLPYADHIIALNKRGEVAEQGNYQEVSALGGYVSSFDLPPADWRFETKHSKLDDLMSAMSTTKIVQAPPIPMKIPVSDDDFEANKRTGDLSIYLYYTRSVGVFAVCVFLVAICGYVFCISFPQVWLSWWAAANARHPNGNMGYYLGIYVMLGVLGLASLVVSCWQIIITMVPRTGESFHKKLLTTVLAAPMSFFSTTDTGITLNRFSQDLQLVDMELPISALNFFTAFIICIAQMVLIGFASLYAAVSFPLFIVVLYLVQKFYLRTSRQLRFLDLEAKSPLYSQFTEVLAGLITVRAFGWQTRLEEKNRTMLDQSQKPFYLLFAVQRWLQLVLDLLVAAVAVLLMVLVVELRGVLGGGYVGIALLNVVLFSQYLKLLLQYWTMLETHIGAVARIKNFASATTSEDMANEDKKPPPSWPSEGAIRFDHVSASYDSSHLVLKNLSLSIHAGEKIGICGRTGSGKSSMIMAIFRMLELRGGKIGIDGVDISTISRREIRSKIIGLPQDVFLLSGTVRLNLDPYYKATDDAIITALQDVKLWENIKEKGGLDTDIEAVNLSHGQKQLLCLAQALLRKSSILILDEATSSVDDVTDELIQKIIRQKFARHTIIAVAHKLDSITDFDKVALLEKGSLKEFDSPHALLDKKSSAFKQLYYNSIGGAPLENPVDDSESEEFAN